MLSMPSTISSAVRVTSAAQAFGIVEQFEHAVPSVRFGCRSSPGDRENKARWHTVAAVTHGPGDHVAHKRDTTQAPPSGKQRTRQRRANVARGTDGRMEPGAKVSDGKHAIAAAAIHGSGRASNR